MNNKFIQRIANGENVKLTSAAKFIAVTKEDDEEEFFCHHYTEYPKDAVEIDESKLDHSQEYTLFEKLPFKEYKGYKHEYYDEPELDHFHHEDDFSDDPEFADLPTLKDLHKTKTM